MSGATGEPPQLLGGCILCGDPVWSGAGAPVTPEGPAHNCCAVHAVENPGQPCMACAASKSLNRQQQSRRPSWSPEPIAAAYPEPVRPAAMTHQLTPRHQHEDATPPSTRHR